MSKKAEFTMTQIVLIMLALALLALSLIMIGGFRESILSTLSSILRMGR